VYAGRALAVWLQKIDPKTDGAARDWVAIYDECSRILYQEIDYTLEGKNADAFRQNFSNVDWIKVSLDRLKEHCHHQQRPTAGCNLEVYVC
jgi:predicted unusual protein kinase regulating ubiquinone biosynthesis (AarF/ABC1/UbiB family)